MKTFATLAAAAGLTALVAAPAMAQEMEMSQAEMMYDYQQSVVAYERCNGIRFDQEQSTALQSRITQLIGGFLSPGLRLEIVWDATEEMQALANANGCGFAPVADALQRFESDLAPALGS
jgi:hypothetical protein